MMLSTWGLVGFNYGTILTSDNGHFAGGAALGAADWIAQVC